MSESSVTTVDEGHQKVARQVTVKASASDVFDLVVNPHRHHELDGSGTVADHEVRGPRELRAGDKFTVAMKQFGVPYKITSTATTVETNRIVEWRHPLGHTWRWEMDEVLPGQTTVTETFDYSSAKVPRILELMKVPQQNARGITETLRKLADRFA